MPTLLDYIEARDAALTSIEASAGEAFAQRARAFILSELRSIPCLTGEQITDMATEAGIVPANGDGRSFGPVIMRLAKEGLIVRSETPVRRRKGHGSIGANLWRLK